MAVELKLVKKDHVLDYPAIYTIVEGFLSKVEFLNLQELVSNSSQGQNAEQDRKHLHHH